MAIRMHAIAKPETKNYRELWHGKLRGNLMRRRLNRREDGSLMFFFEPI